MKIKIYYEFSGFYNPPFFASTRINGSRLEACGTSYRKAKEELIVKVKRYLAAEGQAVPPSEEIDIDV